jgi:prophage regulatory protein
MKRDYEGTLPPTLHPEQRLTYAQAMALVGWGRSKLAAEVKAGRFPQPERDGRRCTRWRAGDVLAFLSERRANLTTAR